MVEAWVQAWQNLQYSYNLKCMLRYFHIERRENEGNWKIPTSGFRLLLFESHYFCTITCSATKLAEMTLITCFCVVAMRSSKKIRELLTSQIFSLCFL